MYAIIEHLNSTSPIDAFTEAKQRYIAHALSENRNGLIVDMETTQVVGSAEVGAM